MLSTSRAPPELNMIVMKSNAIDGISLTLQGLKPVALLAENRPVVGKDSKIPMHEKHPSGAVLTFDS